MKESIRKKLADIEAVSRPQPRKTLSVILSFWNEEDVLEELIRRLRLVLGGQISQGKLTDYELIFVNDVSTDRSLEILHEQARGHHDIKVLTMSRNFGTSPCVLAGMEFSSGDAVVYMDADLQDPPEVIAEMIAAWQDQEADVVHTQRITRKGESRIKMWITKLGYRIIGYVSEVRIQRNAGDFKLLSRRAVDHLTELHEKKPFLRGLVGWIGFHQVTIRYHREARFAGKTKFPVFGQKVIRNFLNSALISFSDIPLQFSLVAGFFVSFIALCVLIYVVLQRIIGTPTTGWSALMVTMLFLGGVQLMTTGILGLYLNSVYLECKKRPNYIVGKAEGFDESLRSEPEDAPEDDAPSPPAETRSPQ